MDGNKKGPQSANSERHDSLVEKAARKLTTLAADAHVPPSRPITGSNPDSVSGRHVGGALAEPPQAGGPAASSQAPKQHKAQRKTVPAPRSKKVHLDSARLEAAGVITADGPRTKTTEEFRLIKRLVLSKRCEEGARNANLIMVTSAVPGEGKTFVSLNLAMSIACEKDYRVLLVDADLSRPSIPSVMGFEAGKGLVEVLTDESVELSDLLLRTDVDGLTILPSGRPHQLSTELLSSQRMANFVDELSRRYRDRIVIFDSPPVLATSEPSALAQHVGQIVFTVRAGQTSRSAVKAALEILGDCPNIGLVLNGAHPQFGTAQFGYYGYKSYQYSH